MKRAPFGIISSEGATSLKKAPLSQDKRRFFCVRTPKRVPNHRKSAKKCAGAERNKPRFVGLAPDSIYCCAIRYTYGSICLRLDMSLSGRVFLVRQSRTYRIEQSEIYRICIANISNAAGVYRPEFYARRARKIPLCCCQKTRSPASTRVSAFCCA